MSETPRLADHMGFMELALSQAMRCEPTPQAFCVGAVITYDGKVASTGFSRELPGNTHAEACAIDKLLSDKGTEAGLEILKNSHMYTTMEPCSVRLSGNTPCTTRILEVGIRHVYLGTKEPDDFVQCEGVQKLKEQGVDVQTVPHFAEKCLRVAKRGH